MNDKIFFDTNVLLYAYKRDAGHKREKAIELLENAFRKPKIAAISVQVLQEFYVNFLRKNGSIDVLNSLIQDFCRWKVIDNSLPVYRLGIALQQRWQVSLWDAMILAAAQVSQASLLYSEDFNHGQDYGGIRVVNPFLPVD